MSVIVFCGPTIAKECVQNELDAEVRGPAQRGDLLKAALEKPQAIALIDGYFDRVPSVWHKEILWAMSQGIHVFGASSMGALRAAELASFGMVGIGAIYEAFASGELEDDDEVAVVHLDEAAGYRQVSEAMVNIRWTLRAAEREGLIDAPTRGALEAAAKATPYAERHLRLVLDDPGSRQAVGSRYAELKDWLEQRRVDQKREDALAMLRHVATLCRSGWSAKVVDFTLAETDGFTELLHEAQAGVSQRQRRALEPVLEDELHARGQLGQTLAAATMRLLAAERLRRANVTLNARAVEAWIDDFRRERGLLSAESFDEWLEQAGMDDAAAEQFFTREAAVRATRAELRNAVGSAVEDHLLASNELRELLQAAQLKHATLSQRGLESPTLDDAGLTEAQLWEWFFSARLGIPAPLSVDGYATTQGTTVDGLRTAALREFIFNRLAPNLERASSNP